MGQSKIISQKSFVIGYHSLDGEVKETDKVIKVSWHFETREMLLDISSSLPQDYDLACERLWLFNEVMERAQDIEREMRLT